MNHILHQQRDPVMGTVDVYLDVGSMDITFEKDDKAFVAATIKSKFKVGAVLRSHGGTTLFAYPAEIEQAVSVSAIAAMLGCLGRPVPVSVVEGGSQWDRY